MKIFQASIFIFNRHCFAGLLSLFIFFILGMHQGKALAHGDDDHGAHDQKKQSTQIAPANHSDSLAEGGVRFSANTEEIELLAIYRSGTLSVYLDHFADNSPIANAALQLDGLGNKVVLKEIEPGVYQIAIPALKPATYPLTFSVETPELADLLITDLVIPENKISTANSTGANWLSGNRIWGAVALIMGGILLVTTWWRRTRNKNMRKTGQNHA